MYSRGPAWTPKNLEKGPHLKIMIVKTSNWRDFSTIYPIQLISGMPVWKWKKSFLSWAYAAWGMDYKDKN